MVRKGTTRFKGLFLPSLNLKYNLSEKHSLRLGASKTYTLPQPKEISPYRYVGVNFNSQGNANLKPSDNYNVDLKWDFNPTPTELISLTAFYKLIKNPISRIEVASAGGYLSYENIADKATVAGAEVEVRKNLFVRPVSSAANGMNKLSFGLNGSYIYTNAKMPLATVTTGSQLEGAAPGLLILTYLITTQKEIIVSSIHWCSTMSAIKFIPSVRKAIRISWNRKS